MFMKAFSAVFVLALSAQVSAHTMILPALGVTGNPVRNDAVRVNAKQPCGPNVKDIATAVSQATPVQATNGQFTVNVTDFNAGTDGSRDVSATLDPTATGASFPGNVTITKNGDPNPAKTGSELITASLPEGTKCTGGSDGASCLLAFKTTVGFGNCVLVSTGGSGSGAANATSATEGNAAAATNGTSTSTATDGATDSKGTNNSSKHCSTKNKDKRAVGSRAARPMRAIIEARRLEEGTLI